MDTAGCGLMASKFWKVIKKQDNYNSKLAGLIWMKQNEVYVGIPQNKAERKDDEKEPVTNAELLFIHTNGSPVNNIPPRPVIEPALKDDKDRLNSMMKVAAQYAMQGEEEKAIKQLKLTGMRGQNVSRAWFTSPKNNWPPNSPAVEARKRKKGATNPRPLIDTGELRKSITYFVKLKGGERTQ